MFFVLFGKLSDNLFWRPNEFSFFNFVFWHYSFNWFCWETKFAGKLRVVCVWVQFNCRLSRFRGPRVICIRVVWWILRKFVLIAAVLSLTKILSVWLSRFYGLRVRCMLYIFVSEALLTRKLLTPLCTWVKLSCPSSRFRDPRVICYFSILINSQIIRFEGRMILLFLKTFVFWPFRFNWICKETPLSGWLEGLEFSVYEFNLSVVSIPRGPRVICIRVVW